MTKKKTEGVPEHILDVLPRARVQIFGQVVLITLTSIAIFAAIGYALDQKFDSYPTLFVISVFVSFPFTQFFLLRRVHKFGKKRLQASSKK